MEPDYITHLARDMALLTANRLYSQEEILAAYNLTPAEFTNLQQTEAYQTAFSAHQSTATSTDRNALLRAQAKLMVDANLRSLYDMANDKKQKASDRLKAHALIMELADVKPKQEQQFSGMVLNVSFGSSLPSVSVTAPNDPNVIEHQPNQPAPYPQPKEMVNE